MRSLVADLKAVPAVEFVFPGGWRAQVIRRIAKLCMTVRTAPSALHDADHYVVVTISERTR